MRNPAVGFNAERHSSAARPITDGYEVLERMSRAGSAAASGPMFCGHRRACVPGAPVIPEQPSRIPPERLGRPAFAYFTPLVDRVACFFLSFRFRTKERPLGLDEGHRKACASSFLSSS